ncbi:MAG: NADH-quinone oxidoreductase subunit A [Bdellovibrionota bacterium]|nr:NADH-quinone oxidoreductase subunit A [Bdellovibrionota bacterium]
MSHNLDVYMPVLILAGFATIMFVGALLVGKLLRPNNPTELKLEPYECGEEPVGTAWSNFNVRFYVVALIFIIFDVEGALMFPVAAVFKKFIEMGNGGVVLVILLLFVSVLVEGVVYCWKKGDLDWVKSYQVKDEE